MGRTGFPFAANMYGIAPDMITTAKALGAGFPCAALLMADHVGESPEDRRSRHDVRRRPDGLRDDRDRGRHHRERRPARERAQAVAADPRDLRRRARSTGTQGAGFLLGLRTRRPAKDVQRELLEQHDILTGTSGDPHVVRILAPYVLESQHVEAAARALRLPARRRRAQRSPTSHYSLSTSHFLPMHRFLDLADFSRDEVVDLLALAQRLQGPPRAAGARGQDPRPAVPEPVAAHAGVVPGRHAAARRLRRSSSRRARAPGRSRRATARS